MNNDRELLQQALDALYENTSYSMRGDPLTYQDQRNDDTIKELQARLAQPEPAECDGGQCGIGGYCKQCPKTQHEPEPVAWGVPNTRPTEKAQFMMLLHSPDGCQYPEQLVPLYTSPPQREWVGLTDEQIDECAMAAYSETIAAAMAVGVWNVKDINRAIGRAIEAAHGITGDA